MNLDTLNKEDLFNEIADLAREQGVTSKEDWKNLVNQVIESHLTLGEFDPDQDLVDLRTVLTDSWEEYERESGEESKSAISEDPQAPHA